MVRLRIPNFGRPNARHRTFTQPILLELSRVRTYDHRRSVPPQLPLSPRLIRQQAQGTHNDRSKPWHRRSNHQNVQISLCGPILHSKRHYRDHTLRQRSYNPRHHPPLPRRCPPSLWPLQQTRTSLHRLAFSSPKPHPRALRSCKRWSGS